MGWCNSFFWRCNINFKTFIETNFYCHCLTKFSCLIRCTEVNGNKINDDVLRNDRTRMSIWRFSLRSWWNERVISQLIKLSTVEHLSIWSFYCFGFSLMEGNKTFVWSKVQTKRVVSFRLWSFRKVLYNNALWRTEKIVAKHDKIRLIFLSEIYLWLI